MATLSTCTSFETDRKLYQCMILSVFYANSQGANNILGKCFLRKIPECIGPMRIVLTADICLVEGWGKEEKTEWTQRQGRQFAILTVAKRQAPVSLCEVLTMFWDCQSCRQCYLVLVDIISRLGWVYTDFIAPGKAQTLFYTFLQFVAQCTRHVQWLGNRITYDVARLRHIKAPSFFENQKMATNIMGIYEGRKIIEKFIKNWNYADSISFFQKMCWNFGLY